MSEEFIKEHGLYIVEHKMDFTATQFVETVTGTVPCCEHHGRQLVALMQFMGSSSNVTPILQGELHTCSNCLNNNWRKS